MPAVDTSETRQRRNVRLAVLIGLVAVAVIIVAVASLALGVFRGDQSSASSGATSVAFEVDYKAIGASSDSTVSLSTPEGGNARVDVLEHQKLPFAAHYSVSPDEASNFTIFTIDVLPSQAGAPVSCEILVNGITIASDTAVSSTEPASCVAQLSDLQGGSVSSPD